MVHRRFSFPRRRWVLASEFNEDDVRALPDETAYLAALKTSSPQLNMPYIASGSDMGDC